MRELLTDGHATAHLAKYYIDFGLLPRPSTSDNAPLYFYVDPAAVQLAGRIVRLQKAGLAPLEAIFDAKRLCIVPNQIRYGILDYRTSRRNPDASVEKHYFREDLRPAIQQVLLDNGVDEELARRMRYTYQDAFNSIMQERQAARKSGKDFEHINEDPLNDVLRHALLRAMRKDLRRMAILQLCDDAPRAEKKAHLSMRRHMQDDNSLAPRKDWTFCRVGWLLVVGRAGTDANRRATWTCQCECGRQIEADSRQLARLEAVSCGECGRPRTLNPGKMLADARRRFGRLPARAASQGLDFRFPHLDELLLTAGLPFPGACLHRIGHERARSMRQSRSIPYDIGTCMWIRKNDSDSLTMQKMKIKAKKRAKAAESQ